MHLCVRTCLPACVCVAFCEIASAPVCSGSGPVGEVWQACQASGA